MLYTSCQHSLQSKCCHRCTALLVLLLLLGTAGAAFGDNSTNSTAEGQAGQQSSSATPSSLAYPYVNDSSLLHCWGWAPSCFGEGSDKPIFAFVGDSITTFGFNSDGWATMLNLAYKGAVNMVNYGVEGATTRRVDEVADKLLFQLGHHLQQVQLVTIWFGTNDAVTSRAPKWHVALPQYKENLQRLIGRLQDKGISKIVLMTPPPVGRRGDRKNEWTTDYAKTVRELGQELNLPTVDIFTNMMAVDKWQELAIDYDQLHLSPYGQQIVYDNLVQVLINSTNVGPAQLLEAQQEKQQLQQQLMQQEQQLQQHEQQHPQQQQQQPGHMMGVISMAEGGHALKVVLAVVLALLFLAVVTESKKQPHSQSKKETA